MPSELELPRRGPRVFVSYSFSNPSIAEFRHGLERRGFNVTVVNDVTLLGAASLSEAISRLIRDADYVVPLVDRNAVGSLWVQKELQLAGEHGVPIVPVLESGVEPAGPFADVACVLTLDLDKIASRLLDDYVSLNFDSAYPAHIEPAGVAGYMTGDKPGLVDVSQSLSRQTADVVRDIQGAGHAQVNAQAVQEWNDLQHALDELGELAPSYRPALRRFLKGWSGPERRAVASWNALSRLIVGGRLVSLISTWPPEDRQAWGAFRSGAARMLEEWASVDEADPLTHLLLWGIGRRTFPFEDWSKDHASPLGSWLMVEATVYTGQTFMMILPDREVIASGLRLGEPPRIYLETWEWVDYVLPQLAYRRVPLSADEGPNMLVRIRRS